MSKTDEQLARELVEAALDDYSDLRVEHGTATLLSAASVYASLHLATQQTKAAEAVARNAALVEQLLTPPPVLDLTGGPTVGPVDGGGA